MPVVWIPAQLRELTGGIERVQVPGRTLCQVIEALEALHPGLQSRLLEGEALRPGMVALVNGATRSQRLSQPLEEESEVHFIRVISGGTSRQRRRQPGRGPVGSRPGHNR